MNVDVIPMLEIMMERLLFTMPAGKHTLYLIIIGCYGTWFVCVCAFYSPTMHLSHNKTYFQGQRTIEFLNLAFKLNLSFFSKNALFRSYSVFTTF